MKNKPNDTTYATINTVFLQNYRNPRFLDFTKNTYIFPCIFCYLKLESH